MTIRADMASRSCVFRLLFALLVIAACTPNTVFGEGVSAKSTSSRYYRTAAEVQAASEALRADFAVVALGLLAEAYREEAELAREESRELVEETDLRGWAGAVERYARQFALLLEDVELGFPVALEVRPGEPVAITVADRVLILTHPRLVHQESFEQQILQSFCSRQSCEQFVSRQNQEEAIPEKGSRVRPLWSFSSDGPVCSHAGIEIHFPGTVDLARARITCAEVLAEAVSLATEIAWQVRHAVTVDWGALALFETPGRPGHRLQLNAVGDAVLATVPVIYRSAGLLEQLAGWMRGRVERKQNPVLILQAVNYGWGSHNPQPSSRD